MHFFPLSLILLSSSIFKPTSCTLPCLRKCATVNVFNALYWAPPMSTASASSTASLHIPCLRLSAGQSLTRCGLSFKSYISESEARDKCSVLHPITCRLGMNIQSWHNMPLEAYVCFYVTLKLLSNPTTPIQFCLQPNHHLGFHTYPNFCISDLVEISKIHLQLPFKFRNTI